MRLAHAVDVRGEFVAVFRERNDIFSRAAAGVPPVAAATSAALPLVVAVPVLADIGLVKDVTTADAGHPTSDVTLGGVGTPGYGAPEQLVRGEVSFASDIHALGVLADHCFNGNPPHACVITGNFENVVLPQKHLTASTGFLLYYCRIVLGEKQMSTKCRYCGSVSYGSGCYHSPTGKHEK